MFLESFLKFKFLDWKWIHKQAYCWISSQEFWQGNWDQQHHHHQICIGSEMNLGLTSVFPTLYIYLELVGLSIRYNNLEGFMIGLQKYAELVKLVDIISTVLDPLWIADPVSAKRRIFNSRWSICCLNLNCCCNLWKEEIFSLKWQHHTTKKRDWNLWHHYPLIRLIRSRTLNNNEKEKSFTRYDKWCFNCKERESAKQHKCVSLLLRQSHMNNFDCIYYRRKWSYLKRCSFWCCYSVWGHCCNSWKRQHISNLFDLPLMFSYNLNHKDERGG